MPALAHCKVRAIPGNETACGTLKAAAAHARGKRKFSNNRKKTTMEITLVPGNSLITATPEEGRHLAIKMARLVIKATQPDDAVRGKLRDVYANSASDLIQVGQVVALEFATIAAANNYWRG